MSPRWAGSLLLAGSAVAGVLGVALIGDGRWAIPAACLLAAAAVGAGIGTTWLLRRSWDDRRWPHLAPVPEARRTRRERLTVGFLLLVLAAASGGYAAWSAASGAAGPREAGLLALGALYGAGGIAALRTARLRGAADAGADRPAGLRPEGRDGWRTLGPRANPVAVLALVGPAVALLALTPVQLLFLLDEFPWGIAVWAVCAAAALVAAAVLLRRRAPRVDLDETGERLRAGRRVARWTDVTQAQLIADPPGTGVPRTLILVLRDDRGLRAPLVLRRRERLALSDAETRLALRLLDASSIDLPRAKEDPRGRFSRHLFPTHLTVEEARAVVAAPPAMHEPLPVG